MHSLKKEIINSLSISPTVEGMSENKVTLVTAAGLITGIPAVPPFSDKGVEFMDGLLKNLTNSYRTENSITANTRLDGNDGFVALTEVTLTSGNSVTSMNYLAVFFDQIIAVTIGH